MSNPVVILGGSGFIGTHMCTSIEPGGFRILDKQKSNTFPDETEIVDVLDKGKLTQLLQGTPCVVNLAAEHKDNVTPVSLYNKVNVEGAQVLCDACEANGIEKIIFTSSVAVYGLNKVNPDESHPTDPFNHYGKSKLAAEEVYIRWQKADPENRSLVIVRPTVVFGEKNRGNVYSLLKQIASGRFFRIGKGENKKSMAYVGNISAFLIHAVKTARSGFELYNYVDTPDLSMNELVSICEKQLKVNISKVKVPVILAQMGGLGFDLMSKISGKKFAISRVRVTKFCATTQFNASKAHASDFNPPYTLKEGLIRTLNSEFR